MAIEQHEGYRRDGTEADLEKAKAVAVLMVEAIPPGTTSDIMVAAGGLVLRTLILKCIKRQFVVRAFEDFAFFTRSQLIEAMRDAH
jgi:hypothetical protein